MMQLNYALARFIVRLVDRNACWRLPCQHEHHRFGRFSVDELALTGRCISCGMRYGDDGLRATLTPQQYVELSRRKLEMAHLIHQRAKSIKCCQCFKRLNDEKRDVVLSCGHPFHKDCLLPVILAMPKNRELRWAACWWCRTSLREHEYDAIMSYSPMGKEPLKNLLVGAMIMPGAVGQALTCAELLVASLAWSAIRYPDVAERGLLLESIEAFKGNPLTVLIKRCLQLNPLVSIFSVGKHEGVSGRSEAVAPSNIEMDKSFVFFSYKGLVFFLCGVLFVARGS